MRAHQVRCDFHLVRGGVGGTVASESALRSAGTFRLRVRAPLPAPWPDGGPESLGSPCCGLALYKNQSIILSECRSYPLYITALTATSVLHISHYKSLSFQCGSTLILNADPITLWILIKY
ncbi:hypothetical protein PoB_003798300 [Plakobranchus ocellatus]|uniref:Uncharacterized protein n=1 Tax=Plakobranchus ocellatus TaxID=259542 RepID=A0AAV4AXA9_9GAST|nr:hypothetical protein PoB_003798300 [Plakobranchus ocellatus]